MIYLSTASSDGGRRCCYPLDVQTKQPSLYRTTLMRRYTFQMRARERFIDGERLPAGDEFWLRAETLEVDLALL